MVVSCVSVDTPYRPHPHSLIGKEGCKKGVCTLEIDPGTMTVSFPSLGIQCVKRKEIEAALVLRQQIRVDPFQSKVLYSVLMSDTSFIIASRSIYSWFRSQRQPPIDRFECSSTLLSSVFGR